MSYLLAVPMDDGGEIVVQVSGDDVGGLELAGRSPGEVVGRASETLEATLRRVRPVARAVREQLSDLAPVETSVEFGVVLGTEAGVVLAKGSTEVHLTVTLTWRDAAAGKG